MSAEAILSTLSPQDLDEIDIHSPEFVLNPYPYYRQLRERLPLMHSELYGGFWMFTRFQDIRDAAIDWRTYTSSVAGVTAIPVITPRTEPMLPIELDPPVHSRYRALMGSVFSSARIQELRPRVEEIARGLVEQICTLKEVDLVSSYCVPLSVQTLAAFSGLPVEDTPIWIDWIRKMFDVHHPDARDRAASEFGIYIDDKIRERHTHPSEDFFSMLITAHADGIRLSDAEIHSFSTVLFGAGFETTWDALSIMLLELARNPEDASRLRTEPQLIPSAVEEYLRFGSPIQIFGRNTTRDVHAYGRVIPRGNVVAMAFGSANHDESVFPDPEQIQIDRSPNRHVTFGAGPHFCLGAPVARLEMAVTLQEVLPRIHEMAIPNAEKLIWKTRGDRHGLAFLPAVIQ